jgi:hypothetical protein
VTRNSARAITAVGVCVAMLAGGGVAASGRAADAAVVGAATASARPVFPAASVKWGNAEELPGSAALNVGGNAAVDSVSCASPGNCGAGGDVTPASGHVLPLVDSQVNGVWGAASVLPGAAAFSPGGDMVILSMSCPAAGDCSAGGVYDSQSSSTSQAGQAFVASEVNGAWHAPVQVAGALNAGDDAQVSQVSCATAGNCAAVGYYTDSSGNAQPFVVSEAGGAWGAAQQVLNAGEAGAVYTVSCAAPGDCSAGGALSPDLIASQAFVVDEARGAWGTAQVVPGSDVLNAGYSAHVNSLSCGSPGNCAAGGGYSDGSGAAHAFAATSKGGTWGSAVEVPGTAALNTAGGAAASVVSCAPTGTCGVAGDYDVQASGSSVTSARAFVASVAGGHWQDAEQLPGTVTGALSGTTFITGMSCPAPGDCAAGGIAALSPDGTSGVAFVGDEAGGTWDKAEVVPGLGALQKTGASGVTSVSCATAGNCTAGGIYPDKSGRYQAFVVSSTSCDQVTDPDGAYEFGGCVTPEDAGTIDVTTQQSNVDGIDVSASPSDEVTYDDGGSAGDKLLSSGSSTLSLDLGGTLTPVSTGKLDDSLTGPITIAIPAAAKPSLGGLPISGNLTITPGVSGTPGRSSATPTGTATGTMSTTLPTALGGGKATLKITTTVNKGITKATATIAKASFLQLFSMSNVMLGYASSSGGKTTWTVDAATTAGKTAGKLSGTLVFAGGTLASAKFSGTNFSLAGLADLSTLSVSYSKGKWAGTAVIGSGASATTAAINLSYDSSGLVSGSVKASNVPVFGVLDVKTFDLSYSGDTWKITMTAADGGRVDGSLTANASVISAGRLTVTKVSLLGKLTVDTATVSYSEQAPNSACPKVDGGDIWCGDWRVLLPSASVVDGVSGTMAVADGAFASGSIDVKGNVPLLDGIVLTELGGSITVNPPPTKISGTAGLRFGPKIKGTSLVAFKGTLTRTLPGDDTSGSYILVGDFNALGKLTGHVNVTVPGDGSATTIDLTASVALSKATASGKVTGSFATDSINLSGDVTITVLGLTVHGTLKADNTGMAACGSYKDKSGHTYVAGFEYDWNGSFSFYGKTGCTERGF